MKYVLIWCREGSLIVQIDGNDFTLEKHEVITITSGQIHFIKESREVEGYILEFTYDFFCKDDKDVELIFENGLFCHFDENQVIPVSNFEAVTEQLKLINQELNEEPYQYLTSVHSRIELILVEINRSKINRGDEIWKPDALLLKFLELVRAGFNSTYTLAQYAEKLKTTEQKLNDQAKTHTGKTAQMVVYGLIASEAKRLLIYESLSVKEIAFQLGFKDPFYFSNFFKKHTGVSPKVYRDQIG
ncbi:AraC-like DNA-binding protein [Algoriphagus sp. 4150]|uniref:helix-turn-helix domain-containing protein n=1 Tax=Algoriphagus sp. 4150 TaxID=2817756 RepID=UPI0028671C3D|nr:helix-turn-helix domain-containing protein [Algoriphagus sp. 4150]MDR7130280.1 AraC-like DNA-binding protein [Algoriphagus sp. 4150]